MRGHGRPSVKRMAIDDDDTVTMLNNTPLKIENYLIPSSTLLSGDRSRRWGFGQATVAFPQHNSSKNIKEAAKADENQGSYCYKNSLAIDGIHFDGIP